MTIAAPLVTEPHTAAAVDHRAVTLGEAAVVLALLGGLGLSLYRPWEPIPFPIVDFGGWLVLLTSSSGVFEAFRALAAEHAREGRINPLSMGYVALNWGMFGDSTPAWQLLRGAIMLAIAGGAYVLLRRLGAHRGAAFAGSCLFLVADSARAVWLMPQAFEHVAAALVIGAAVAALDYGRTAQPRTRAALIALLLVLAVWVREPMVAAVPFVVILALTHRGDGRFEWPRIDRRSVELVAVVGIAVLVLNAVPVFAVRAVTEPGAYASRFGPENISAVNVRNVAFALLLPITRAPWFPANALFVLAVAIALVGTSDRVRAFRRALVVAATLPLGAAMIYVMWPGFPGNYGLPYLLGVVIIFALALTVLWTGARWRRGLALVATTVVVGLGSVLALNDRRQYTAARLLDVDMATTVSTVLGSRPLEVAFEDPTRSGAFGRALRAYSMAMLDAPNAPASDVDCASAAATAVGEGATGVLRPPHGCSAARMPNPTTVLRRSTVIRDWKTLRSQPWDVTAELWDGGATSRVRAPR